MKEKHQHNIINKFNESIILQLKNAQITSTFRTSFTKLGFKDLQRGDKTVTLQDQVEALLNIFNMAGYFDPKKLWQDINHISTIINKKETFISVINALKSAKDDLIYSTNFNAHKLYHQLESIFLKDEEWMDIFIYISQHAFYRNLGQERNEMISQNWMEQPQYKEEYIKSANILGLIERKMPKLKEYDATWIAGASRLGVFARILDYKYILATSNIKIMDDNIYILAGARELWAELDGIEPKIKKLLNNKSIINIDDIEILVPTGNFNSITDEGKEYILYLSEKYNIKLNEEQPFIKYEKGQIPPPERFLNRTYANYNKEEKNKFTETLTCKDLANELIQKEVVIIDTQQYQNQRPTSYTTALEATNHLLKKIINKDDKSFNILYISNNPYIERQEIVTQLAVNKILEQTGLRDQGYEILVDGVGFANKQDIVTIHSELAALMAEKWKMAHFHEKNSDEHLSSLLFQSRDKESFCEPFSEELGLIGLTEIS